MKPQTVGQKTARGSYSTQGKSLQPGEDLLNYVKEYAREKPDVAALWCFGLGIIVGWKIKPW